MNDISLPPPSLRRRAELRGVRARVRRGQQAGGGGVWSGGSDIPCARAASGGGERTEAARVRGGAGRAADARRCLQYVLRKQ